MYGLVAFFSFYIRQYYLPNPFEALSENIIVFINGYTIELSPIILNYLASFLLCPITFAVTRIYYEEHSNAALGSFLYLIFYCVHTFLLWLMALANFATWAIGGIIIVYIGVHIMFFVIRNRGYAAW